MAIILLAAAAPALQNPSAFFIRITETKIDLSPAGITAGDCIAVQPDGRFHLERRLQQLPSTSAKLTVFEARLTKAQLRQLRRILEQPDMWNLAEFAPPPPPFGVSDFGTFMAEINQQSAVRQIGYFVWRGTPRPGVPPYSTPDSIKHDWQEAQEALKPLELWFHKLENQEMQPSKAAPNFCGKNIDSSEAD